MFQLSLTQRYIPAIMMLVVFIVFSHVLINRVVNSNQELAKIINISGKQRMLSQRLIIVGQDYYEDALKRDAFIKTLHEIKASHKYLLTKISTKELNDIYFAKGLNSDLKNYLKHFDNLLVLNNPMFLKTARENSKLILIKLDAAVKEYERYSNEKLEDASSLEFIMMFATLFILLLEVLFIFRPAAKKIDNNTKSLIENQVYEETVIESNHNAIIAIDWTGKITTYNQRAVDIFGWTKKEMIGKRNLLNIIPPKYKKLHTDASSKYLSSGKSCGILGKSHELEGIRKDGTIFPIKISFGSEYNIKNTIVVANISDISKEKEQNNILIQQTKMASMGEMMANIAHQWRQPLSVISTATSGIQVEKEFGVLEDSVLDKRLESIMHNTSYLSQTIEDFTNFFKPSKKKEGFLVGDILIKVENIIGETFKENNITLNKNYNKKTNIRCIGFANELSQVLVNILNNAKDILIERECEEKIIKVELNIKDDDIFIKILDNADGISDDILPKIFDPYFTTKHQSQGTGIGLYMSSEIIHNHFSGSIRAANEKFTIDDKNYYGACFNIQIPTNLELNES